MYAMANHGRQSRSGQEDQRPHRHHHRSLPHNQRPSRSQGPVGLAPRKNNQDQTAPIPLRTETKAPPRHAPRLPAPHQRPALPVPSSARPTAARLLVKTTSASEGRAAILKMRQSPAQPPPSGEGKTESPHPQIPRHRRRTCLIGQHGQMTTTTKTTPLDNRTEYQRAIEAISKANLANLLLQADRKSVV